MKMITITTLIENRSDAEKRFASEHGLSLLIQTPSGTVLFDTGTTAAFLDNAEKMSVDVSQADHVVISHAHYDHSGGYAEFVSRYPGRPLWVGQGFFKPKYSIRGGESSYSGIPFSRELIKEHEIQLHEVSDSPVTIMEGVQLFRGFPRVHAFEPASDDFYLKTDSGFQLDTFDDEVLLALEADDGIIVIVGCSHPGIVNMVDAVRSRFTKPVQAVIGGTHLMHAGPDRILTTIDFFKSIGVKRTAVSHCTGERAMHMMADEMETFTDNRTGTVLTFD